MHILQVVLYFNTIFRGSAVIKLASIRGKDFSRIILSIKFPPKPKIIHLSLNVANGYNYSPVRWQNVLVPLCISSLWLSIEILYHFLLVYLKLYFILTDLFKITYN